VSQQAAANLPSQDLEKLLILGPFSTFCRKGRDLPEKDSNLH
jgi:hypothetical protein